MIKYAEYFVILTPFKEELINLIQNCPLNECKIVPWIVAMPNGWDHECHLKGYLLFRRVFPQLFFRIYSLINISSQPGLNADVPLFNLIFHIVLQIPIKLYLFDLTKLPFLPCQPTATDTEFRETEASIIFTPLNWDHDIQPN